MTSPEFALSGGDVDHSGGRSEEDDDDDDVDVEVVQVEVLVVVVVVVVLGASSDVIASPAGAA